LSQSPRYCGRWGQRPLQTEFLNMAKHNRTLKLISLLLTLTFCVVDLGGTVPLKETVPQTMKGVGYGNSVQRQNLSVSFPNTSSDLEFPSLKLDPEEKAYFDRAVAEDRETLFFEYGKLPDNHPATLYVRDIAGEVFGKDAEDYQVFILPDLHEINAMAFPDGTIVIGEALMRFVKHTEELKAIILHEAIHIRRKHNEMREVQLKRITDDIVREILAPIGITRIFELEADMRWVFGEFDKFNVNPLGLATFSERYAILQENTHVRESWNFTHGSMQDRALNMESIFYFFDLETLSHDLGDEIPETIKQSLANSPNRHLHFRSDLSDYSSPEELEIIKAKRLALAREMPIGFITLAIRSIGSFLTERPRKTEIDAFDITEKPPGYDDEKYEPEPLFRDEEPWESKPDSDYPDEVDDDLEQEEVDAFEEEEREQRMQKAKAAEKRAHNRKVFNILLNRIDRELFPKEQWPHDQERDLAIDLFLELYNRTSNPSAIARIREKFPFPTLTQPEDILLIAKILDSDKFESLLPLIPASSSPLFLTQKITLSLIEILNIREDPTKSKIEQFVSLVNTFSQSLSGFYQSQATSKLTVENIQTSILGHLEKALGEDGLPFFNLAQEMMGISEEKEEPKFDSQIKEGDRELVEQIHRQITRNVRFNESFSLKSYQEVLDQTKKHLADKSKEEVIRFFQIATNTHRETLWSNIALKVTELKAQKQTAPVFEETSADVASFKLQMLALYRLFEHVVVTWPQFEKISEDEKNAFLIKTLNDSVFSKTLFVDEELILQKKSGAELSLATDNTNKFSDFAIMETDIDPLTGQTVVAGESSVLTEKDQAYLESKLNTVEEIWLQRKRTAPQIHYLYEVFYAKEGTPFFTKEIFSLILAKYFADTSGWQDFFDRASLFEKQGIPIFEIMKNHRTNFGVVLSKIWPSLPASPNRAELEMIRKLIDVVVDPFLQGQLATYYYELIWPTLDFNEKLDLIFENLQSGIFETDRLNTFIEEEVETEAQLRGIRNKIKRFPDSLIANSSQNLGIASIASEFDTNEKFKLELLLALLTSWESDQDLQTVLMQTIYSIFKPSTGDDKRDVVNDTVETAENIKNRLLRMSEPAKWFLLRRLLTGKAGLISQLKNRNDFFSALLEKTVEREESSTLMGVIDEVISALTKAKNWKPLFFALQHILTEQIGIPPEEQSPLNTLMLEQLTGDFNASYIHAISTYFHEEKTLTAMAEDAERQQKLFWRFNNNFTLYSEELLRQELIKRGVVSPEQKRELFSPLAFTVEVGQHIGSLAVRFLQLLPQFMELSDEEQKAFSHVYDGIFGQSKLAATAMLEREWPEIWDEIAKVEERVGGGSLMTVYKVEPKEGKKEVIKVLNPNLEFLLETSVTFVEELLDILEEQNGKKYTAARMVLEDVREWIERDVNFEGFLEKDKQFREENSGFTEEGFAYEMYVPESKGPDSKFFIREEFIEGLTLTQWDEIIQAGHDPKQIVSLIVKNHVSQLERGRVHSDVHIGNFRMTDDRRIAILDRNFSLELDEKMQEIVETILNPMKLAAMPSPDFIQLLVATSRTPVSDEARAALIQFWDGTKAEIMQGNWGGVSQFLVAIREQGLRLPLEMTLTFKNLNSLQQLSLQAGFGNLFEAFLFTPEPGPMKPIVREVPQSKQKADSGRKNLGTRSSEVKIYYESA